MAEDWVVLDYFQAEWPRQRRGDLHNKHKNTDSWDEGGELVVFWDTEILVNRTYISGE
jgi:hypothetical protein